MDESKREALADLVKDADPAELSKALHETAPDVYQHIFGRGHSEATSRLKGKAEEVHTELDTLKSEVEKRDAMIAKLKETSPDLAKIEGKYETVLQQKDEKITSLARQIEETQRAAVDTIASKNVEFETERIVNKMIREFGVDPDYARVAVMLPGFKERLRLDDSGTITGALASDGVTPVSLSEGQSLSDALARDLAKGVPPKFIEDRRQGGSRLGTPGGKGSRKWKASEISSLSESEYSANRDEIMQAMSRGDIVEDQ